MEKGFCEERMNDKKEILEKIDWKFRHVRYADSFGVFHKVQKKISSYDKIINYLNSVKYLDAYYSVASFLNPHTISSRTKEKSYEDMFLGMDLFFDIDVTEKSFKQNIELSKNYAKEILLFSEKKGWKLRYCAFSGSKGIHLSFFDPFLYSSQTPFEREQEAIDFRKKLILEMKDDFVFDQRITADSRRIVRIPGTFNSKTGYLCSCIDIEDLSLPIDEFLRRIPRNKLWEIRSRIYSAMTVFHHYSIFRLLGFLLKPHNKTNFIVGVTSNAKKNQIICLELKKNSPVEKVFSFHEIPYIIFSTPERKRYVFSPSIVQKNFLFKLAKKINSPSFSQLKTYGHTVVPLQYFDNKMKEVGENKVIKIQNLCFCEKLSNNHASFFKKIEWKSNLFDGFDLHVVFLEIE
jgi:hypothetical protein